MYAVHNVAWFACKKCCSYIVKDNVVGSMHLLQRFMVVNETRLFCLSYFLYFLFLTWNNVNQVSMFVTEFENNICLPYWQWKKLMFKYRFNKFQSFVSEKKQAYIAKISLCYFTKDIPKQIIEICQLLWQQKQQQRQQVAGKVFISVLFLSFHVECYFIIFVHHRFLSKLINLYMLMTYFKGS